MIKCDHINKVVYETSSIADPTHKIDFVCIDCGEIFPFDHKHVYQRTGTSFISNTLYGPDGYRDSITHYDLKCIHCRHKASTTWEGLGSL